MIPRTSVRGAARVSWLWPLLLALSACAPTQRPTDPSSAALAAATESIRTAYKIAAQDLLDVNVFQEPDLTRTVRVSDGGTINFPLVGEVAVAGLTAFEAEATLTEKLKTYIVSPSVSIDVKSYHSRTVFVLGEVAKPGSYDMPADRTLSTVEAIALAGGFTKFASANAVRVVRRTDGQQKTLVVPVGDVTKGAKEKDVPLQPDDVVFVPQTLF